MDQIVRFAQQEDGRQNLGVSVSEAFTVLVSPRSMAGQGDAERFASMVLSTQNEISRLEQQVIELRDALTKARAARSAAEASLDAVLTGKRRFFGQVLMKPATPGDWKGEVWLLDPDKQDRGWGLRFASVADVRREYPELWIIAKTNDGILLDVAPIPR